MKVIVIGMSPYNTCSTSRIHRWILERFFKENHDVLSLSWAHDISYYVPDDEGRYWYNFQATISKGDEPVSPLEYRIPIIPLKSKADPIPVYELISMLEPDLVITIGELSESSTMKAVKTFVSKPFKWLSVLTQSQFPINEETSELIGYIDGVLCVSRFGKDAVSKFFDKPDFEFQFVGSDCCFVSESLRSSSRFRIMAVGKTTQADNLPMIMEVCSKLRSSIPELELYVHANIHDKGEYQLESIKNKFDPMGQFIVFPDKFVSLVDGISDEKLAEQYSKSHVFVSVPLVAGSSMSAFEAVACGCFPILSDCPANRDFAIALEKDTGINQDSVLVDGTKLMDPDESYLVISNPYFLASKISDAYKNREKAEGTRHKLVVFSQKNNKDLFVQSIVDMATKLQMSKEVLCLETL